MPSKIVQWRQPEIGTVTQKELNIGFFGTDYAMQLDKGRFRARRTGPGHAGPEAVAA
jgi:hypothetical protein